MNKHSILINAKWHRTTFTPAFIITEQDVQKVIDLYCSEFKDISKNWTGINDSAAILPRSHGGKSPGA